MKWLGALMLILASGSLGLYWAERIRMRPKQLRECLTVLTLLDTEIFWGGTPLPEAFSLLKERSEGPWQAFFRELENRLQQGEGAGSAWKMTILNQRAHFCLKDEDWLVIQDIGKGLGRSDRLEQHKQIALVKEQLSQIKEHTVLWADKQGKMWSYLGFLGGAAGVILLI